MRLAFVDDDEDARKQFRDYYPDSQTYESLYDAANGVRADVFIIDPTSLAPLMSNMIPTIVSGLVRLMQERPSAEIILFTALSKSCVSEIMDDVYKETKRRIHHVDSVYNFDKLDAELQAIAECED